MKLLNHFSYVFLIILFVPSLAFAQGRRPAQLADGKLSDLNLSGEQWDAIRPLRFDLERKLISLDEQIALARLELQQLLYAKSLEQSSIAQKMGKISQLCVQKKALRLGNWFEIQKLLTAGQQVKWRHALQKRMVRRAGRRGGIHDGPKVGRPKKSGNGSL